MQYGDEEETSVVYQASCKSVMEVMIRANNVHEEDAGSHKVGSRRRVHGSFRNHTFEEMSEFWPVWSECDRKAGVKKHGQGPQS